MPICLDALAGCGLVIPAANKKKKKEEEKQDASLGPWIYRIK